MIFLISLFLLAAPFSPGQTLTMEGRLDGVEAWQGRIDLDDPGRLRLFALAVHDGASLTRAAAGIDSPWIAAGPLAPAGLLRLVESPLASGPAGDVHTQETGLRLDGSYDGGSRSGVLAWPLPGRLGVGAFVRDGRLTALALAAGRPLPALRWEALAARSAPPAAPPGEAWFADEPPWPGGPLAHAALRARVDTGGVEAAAAAGVSAAERAPAGGWALLRLAGHRSGGGADLLLGLADGEARDTAGALLRPLRRAALRAEARAGGLGAWAEASASGAPSALAASAGAGTAALALEAGVRQRDSGAPAWNGAARLEARGVTAEVRRSGGGRLTAEAGFERGPFEISATCCWQEGRLEEIEAVLRAARTPAGGSGTLRPEVDVEVSAGWSQEGARVAVGGRATVRRP